MAMAGLPKHINFWMTSSSKHDCFFQVGPECGPKERIGAIKIFLIGHSEVLREMLEESPLSETECIPVTDSDPETFRNFLICIYSGIDIVVKDLSFEKCLNLLYLCEKYGALDVKEKVSSSYLKNRQQSLSADDLLIALPKYEWIMASVKCKPIDEAIKMAIQYNTADIFYCESFFYLDIKFLELIVQQEKISVVEVDLWKALLRWARNKVGDEDPGKLRSCLGPILPYIRFCSMTRDEFCESVTPSNVLNHREVVDISNAIRTAEAPTLDGLNCELSPRSITTCDTFTILVPDLKLITVDNCSDSMTLSEFYFTTSLWREKDMIRMSLECSNCRGRPKWTCNVRFDVTITEEFYFTDIAKKVISKNFSSEDMCWKGDYVYLPSIVQDKNSGLVGDPVRVFVIGSILSESTKFD